MSAWPVEMMLAVYLLQAQATLGANSVSFDAVEWRFLLSGVTLGPVAATPNPASQWLTDKSWTQILNLNALPAFQVSNEWPDACNSCHPCMQSDLLVMSCILLLTNAMQHLWYLRV